MTPERELALVQDVDGLIRRMQRILMRPMYRAYNLVSSGLFTNAHPEPESHTRGKVQGRGIVRNDKGRAVILRGCSTPRHAVALILGGDYEREMAAIRMLTTDREKALEQHSLSIAREAPIIVSSGAAGPEHLIDLGVAPGAVIFDRRAVCTVTNFTSLVGDLKGLGTREVCIFTSEEHLPRALRIGRLVLGAEGMAVRGFAVEHDKSPEPPPPESVWRSTRDYVRALLWLVSDVDFGMAVTYLRPGRRPETQSELTRLADKRRRGVKIEEDKDIVYDSGVQASGTLGVVYTPGREADQ